MYGLSLGLVQLGNQCGLLMPSLEEKTSKENAPVLASLVNIWTPFWLKQAASRTGRPRTVGRVRRCWRMRLTEQWCPRLLTLIYADQFLPSNAAIWHLKCSRGKICSCVFSHSGLSYCSGSEGMTHWKDWLWCTKILLFPSFFSFLPFPITSISQYLYSQQSHFKTEHVLCKNKS